MLVAFLKRFEIYQSSKTDIFMKRFLVKGVGIQGLETRYFISFYIRCHERIGKSSTPSFSRVLCAPQIPLHKDQHSGNRYQKVQSTFNSFATIYHRASVTTLVLNFLSSGSLKTSILTIYVMCDPGKWAPNTSYPDPNTLKP